MSGDIFGCYSWEVLPSIGKKPGMLLNILQSTEQSLLPQTENHLVQNVHSAEAEKPGMRVDPTKPKGGIIPSETGYCVKINYDVIDVN